MIAGTFSLITSPLQINYNTTSDQNQILSTEIMVSISEL
jgi:hypothetical protein